MNMNIYITPDNEKLLRNHGGSMSGLINGLLEGYFNDVAPSTTTKVPPVTQENTGSPTIRNLEEVYEEETRQYDKNRPFWSPFGPLPITQNPMNPLAVCDPNVDEDSWIPFDVDKRNAML